MFDRERRHLALLELRIKEACPAKDSFEQYIRVKKMSETERKLLRVLLQERQDLLNTMFFGTPAEIERLKEVNDRLFDLTQKLYSKTYNLYTSFLRTGLDPEFDDDIMFEGVLFYNVEDWKEDKDDITKSVQKDCLSVLPMIEDERYGSDFVRMMDLITNLQDNQIHACAHTLISYCQNHKPEMTAEELGLSNHLDDGVSWDHQNTFPGICLCHAAYSLLSDNLFSYPDLLRMNDFWCEVKVTHQCITNMIGERG